MKSEHNIEKFLGKCGVNTHDYQVYMDGGIYDNYEEIPKEYLSIFEKDNSGVRPYDYMGFIKGKKPWVIETLETLQPSTFNILEDKSSELMLGISLVTSALRQNAPPKPRPYLFFDVCGRMIEVQPNFAGSNYEDGDDCFGHLPSLPDALAKSWLWRTGGWRIPGELPEYISTYRQLIGHPAYSWPETDTYLETLGRGYKKKYLPKIAEWFPDCVVEAKTRYDKKHFYFKCFLDTRPSGIAGPVGDQFFVCTKRTDQVVYHIHRGDVDNIRVLHNPAEAIDRYCAHTLLRTPHEFDFMPWSEPLPS